MSQFILTPAERQQCESILRTHSVTYYWSTKLFPASMQDAVFALYAWVREADELVDNPVQDPVKALSAYRADFRKAWQGKPVAHQVTMIFMRLAHTYHFKRAWCEAFLHSMEMDLVIKRYQTRAELDKYIYGSAAVIGYMMAAIMQVPPSVWPQAGMLGSWMQMINFIRDIAEDKERGRCYIPQTQFRRFHLSSHTWQNDPQASATLIRDELHQANQMLCDAWPGILQIPSSCRPAILLSIRLYSWTHRTIAANPSSVWTTRHKPSLLRILWEYGQLRWELFTNRVGLPDGL